MTNFEEDLTKLEKLTADIRRSDISLEDALKDFEEGIKLAKTMQKELDSIESKVQILLKEPEEEKEEPEDKPKAKKTEKKGPELDLFVPSAEINGTRNS